MKCLECNSDLIELGTNEEYVSTDYTVGAYHQWSRYGYWCKFCDKMYVKKHKEWLELWTYLGSNQSIIGENENGS